MIARKRSTVTSLHPKYNSSTCKHEKFVGHAHSLVLHNTFFYGVQLFEHFSHLNIQVTEVMYIDCYYNGFDNVAKLQANRDFGIRGRPSYGGHCIQYGV